LVHSTVIANKRPRRLTDALLQIAPFNVRIRSPFPAVKQHIDYFYSGFARCLSDAFIDFDIQILPGRGFRRWWRPQGRFLLDGVESFYPLPAEQAAPMLEWGLNWCVASRPLGYLVMHAAVLARDGFAVMLPGFPGAGKSTLCASLCLQDEWQLLSDELAILNPATGAMQPHPRPISLKNASLDIVRQFPGARLGPVYNDTRKGTISHVASPPAAVAAASTTSLVRWIVFPSFQVGAQADREAISRAEAFTLISEQSFNRERMGEAGFDALCTMLSGARCFKITYGSTTDGLQLIRDITAMP